MAVELVRIVDAAMAEAVRRGGAWIACRPGCYECCLGPVEVTQADADRLRQGLAELAVADAERAGRVAERAHAARGGDDEPCPALDPDSGTCDLYAWRPVVCRVFGPAVRQGEAVSACELCYTDATDEEVAACAVTLTLPGPEEDVTTVAACLAALP